MTEVKTYYYTDGNTVRQVEQPLPDRHTREREIRGERERKRSKMTFSYDTNLLSTYSANSAKGSKGCKA